MRPHGTRVLAVFQHQRHAGFAVVVTRLQFLPPPSPHTATAAYTGVSESAVSAVLSLEAAAAHLVQRPLHVARKPVLRQRSLSGKLRKTHGRS